MPILGFRHKGLRELFETGRTARIGKPLWRNALLILDRLNAIAEPDDCRVYGISMPSRASARDATP